MIVRPGIDTAVTYQLKEQATRISGVVVTATRGERRVEAEPFACPSSLPAMSSCA